MLNAKFDVLSQTVNIDYKHKNSEQFKKSLSGFVSKYKKVLPPIQQLSVRLEKLQDNEWFFVLPPIELTTKQKYELEKELNKLNGYNNDVSEEKLLEIFGCIMDNYELITFNLDKHAKIKIGENNRDKRVCRFCGLKKPAVSFTKEAHAISEALGNKKIISNEECDTCNEFFDENIERDFVYYHDIARTTFGIKNKDNKIPKMKGKDFELFMDSANELSIAVIQGIERDNKNEPPESVVFNTGHKIKLQNIYKALCKFSLSVIDSEFIKDFKDTIKWLKNESEADALPKIAVWYSYKFFTKRPEITLYLRNNDNKKIPHLVGEFRFAYYMYIFIVPFSSQDDNEFLCEAEYNEFLDCFKQIAGVNEFNYIDFSQNAERALSFTINFKQRSS